jgi:predicted aspartyl protease
MPGPFSVFFFPRRGNLLVCAALLAFSLAAKGDDDPARALGKYLGQHGYGRMGVNNSEANRQMVEAKINGKRVYLAIDTGCDRTILTADCARRLRLDVHDTGKEDWGAGGQIKGDTSVALINSFTLDNYEINRTNIIGVLPKSADLGDEDGLLGFDFLKLNAVILPVGAHFILFKPGNSPAAAIDHYMDLLGFKPIPLQYSKGGLRVEGHLNGHAFTALVDCGAEFTAFDLDYVRKILGDDTSSLNLDMRGLDGRHTTTYGFVPRNLDYGGFPIEPTELGAFATPSFAKYGIDALLGADLLARHQAIIDLGQDTLWLK